MNWIEIKALKSLLKDLQKRPDYHKTLENFQQIYQFRTNLKLPDLQVLLNIAEKINRRHRKNGVSMSSKFGNSQLKLFSWVVVLYCHSNQLLLPALTHQDYLKIQQIFKNVELTRIIYEVKCFCYTKGQIQTPWTEEEIELLRQLVIQKNASQWKIIAYEVFKRSQCQHFRFFEQYRQKWINYLNPHLDKGAWKIQQSIELAKLVVKMGRKWASISRQFKCMRSEHTVKNHHKKMLRELLKIRKEELCKQEANDKRLLAELLKRQEGQEPSDLMFQEKSEEKFMVKANRKLSSEGNQVKTETMVQNIQNIKIETHYSHPYHSKEQLNNIEGRVKAEFVYPPYNPQDPYRLYGCAEPYQYFRAVVEEKLPIVIKEENFEQYEYKIKGVSEFD